MVSYSHLPWSFERGERLCPCSRLSWSPVLSPLLAIVSHSRPKTLLQQVDTSPLRAW
jgi:hypothetical protein